MSIKFIDDEKYLKSELSYLDGLLIDIPKENVIDRCGLERRRDDIKLKLTKYKEERRILLMNETKQNNDAEVLDNMYQVLILTLGNGKKAYFTGKAIADMKEDVVITDVALTIPKPLPESMHFGKIDEDTDTNDE